MYRYFYGINDFPFGACPDPRFLYKMPHVQEALACLQYGIASRKGFVVMTGEVGTGKDDAAQDRAELIYREADFDGVRF